MKMLRKEEVHEACLQQMNAKIETLQRTLDDLYSGAESESKSSAGDKHETGRAMLQIEQARIGKQLSDLKIQRNTLRSIDFGLASEQVALGSLIETDRGWFYLSVALGKVEVKGVAVLSVSPGSPLGSQWLGMRKDESMSFNDTDYTIVNLY